MTAGAIPVFSAATNVSVDFYGAWGNLFRNGGVFLLELNVFLVMTKTIQSKSILMILDFVEIKLYGITLNVT